MEDEDETFTFGGTEFLQLCERIGMARYLAGNATISQDALKQLAIDGPNGIVMTVLRDELNRLAEDPVKRQFLLDRYGEVIPVN